MKRNSILKLWISLIILAIVLIFSVIFYINNLTKNFEQEVLQSMEEVSGQGVISIQTEINGKLHLLEDLARTVEIDVEQEPEELLKEVQTYFLPLVASNDFRGMGIILPNGMAYSTTGDIYNAGQQEFYSKALNGESVITGRIAIDLDASEYVNLYMTPIPDRETQEPIAVLYATYETNHLRSTLEVNSFHGQGYSYLVDREGNTVVDSSRATAFQNMTNILESMAEADDTNTRAVEELQGYLENNESGKIIFQNGVTKYMYCRPVGINDWYLLTVVPESVIDNQMNVVIRNTIVLVIVLAVIFSALIILLVRQQKKKQEELSTLAYVDPVTKGHTFAKFQQIFADTMRNQPNHKYALLSLDLNKFKMINDLYGYEEGNKIIYKMNELWEKEFRANECCGHRTADRFVVLLTYVNKDELEQRIQDYRIRLQEATKGKYKLSLRVGIYQIEDVTDSFSTAYSRSMMAFAAAKDSGKRFMAFYQADMEEQLIWEKNVEDEFQEALRKHEFEVFYQAKINAETGEVSGAEALARWIRPDGTIVPPNRFIPVLENNGSIAELDQYMFKEVCLHQKAWLDEGKPIVPVSVNLSRIQLADSNFVDAYREILESVGLPPEYVGLEFTESAMFDNEEALRSIVDRLHALGVKVLIDDFGVGYSSMMSLKVIPVDILKVDKSFIDSIGDDRGDKIVISIIEFALSLGMSVTAEGVENDNQYRFLRNHRCNDIQGYYFSRPVPAKEYCQRFLASASQ
ncbi:MAG: GGDEF domain-containing protein [Lachnospiraceae bacterium]|nr:GGDEF domain-containing protein [Lachnospiraceae bacterium]